jgi:hypothetical protein
MPMSYMIYEMVLCFGTFCLASIPAPPRFIPVRRSFDRIRWYHFTVQPAPRPLALVPPAAVNGGAGNAGPLSGMFKLLLVMSMKTTSAVRPHGDESRRRIVSANATIGKSE